MNVLDGIRVVDLTRVVAGPWATQNLADLGADVIKIERLGSGEDTRRIGPFLKGADGNPTNDSAFYMGCNRGKRSVAVDIEERGAEIVRELARSASIAALFEIFGPSDGQFMLGAGSDSIESAY